MPHYRATIRFRTDRQRYRMEDVQAPDLRAALRDLADRFPDDIVDSSDLVEIRRQADPDAREFTPEAP